MASVKPPREELRYLIFSEIYHRLGEPKFRRKAFSILEAAITCYAKNGFDHVTLEMVAREAGVTRPLIKHYFKNADDVRDHAMKYIRLLFQKIAIDAMVAQPDPVSMLEAYVRSCFRWLDSSRTHSQVWLSFLHTCSHSRKERLLNTEAVNTGTDRITSLLREGQKQKLFTCADPVAAARALQVMMTGGLISSVSEDAPKNLADLTVEQCHTIAGSVRKSHS